MRHNDHESTAAAQSAASVPLARESETWRRRNKTAAALLIVTMIGLWIYDR